MKLQITAHGAARSDRTSSEDAVRHEIRSDLAIVAIADGLGSAKHGGEAAQRAVNMLVDYYLARPKAWSPRRALTEFVHQINRIFFQESQLRHGSSEVLCTLSAVAFEQDRAYGINVGDSPIFLWRAGTLTRLSEHHALQETNLTHVLTRAVGLTGPVEPYVFELQVDPEDRILLCTDGISAALPETALAEALRRGAQARGLVADARRAAADTPELEDDATAAVVEVFERSWSGASGPPSVDTPAALSEGQHVGPYRLLRPLQEAGRIWLAHGPDPTPVVLKFAPLEARESEAHRDAFLREAWQATRIEGPEFVRAFLPETSVLQYYVMDYVEAPTLRQTLAKNRMTVESAVELARFLLRACQFLLSRDLAHGDLKPDNILVVGNGGLPEFKLIDLGSLAEVFSVTSRAGTPSYLAPERFHGAPLSERTELFSIGVTLYEALGGAYPYGEVERFQTPRFDSHPRRLSRLNAAVPPWVDFIVQRALEPDPARRYQHFSEMAYDLEHPEAVAAHHPKDAPLLERNPLLFYKLLSLTLAVACLALLVRLAGLGE